MRRCREQHPEPAAYAANCRPCWLYVNNAKYRRHWQEQELANAAPVATITRPERKTTAPARVLECIHLGDSLEMPGCKTCKGKHVRECDLFGRCTLSPLRTDVQACSDCGEYRAEPYAVAKIVPDRVQRIDSDKLTRTSRQHFNCSLIEHRGELLMAYRAGWFNSRIWIVQFDHRYQPVANIPVNINHPLAFNSSEDPRLFSHDGNLWLAFCGAVPTNEGVQANQLLARLDDGLQVAEYIAPLYSRRTYPMEKNWTYFAQEGKLHCIYSINPHRILRLDGDRANDVSETAAIFPWAGGLLRGGACPVRRGDEYYVFFHGAKDAVAGGDRLYTMGAYTFDVNPPFAVKRITPFPILVPTEKEKPAGLRAKVVFPCGALVRNDEWIVSYGLHDTFCELAFFGLDKLESALQPVEQEQP